MNNKNLVTGSIALAVLAALAFGAWYALVERPPEICELSGRVIHENMRTVVRLDGKRYHTCCPRCPLTVVQQTGRSVEFLSVTDNPTGRRIKPSEAYFVEGSQVHFCHAPRIKVDEMQTPYIQLFDRCEPSLIAFAREEDALAFQAENGGSLKRLDQLLREVATPPEPAAPSLGEAGE